MEIEYVSAPREYEELLAPSSGDAAGAMVLDDGGTGEDGAAESRGGLGSVAGLGGGGGGLGFVAAGATGGGLGLGFTPAGATPGLGSGGATPGLGSGGATPGLGLGSDWGSETPGGVGLGLGATPMDATPTPSVVCLLSLRCVAVCCLRLPSQKTILSKTGSVLDARSHDCGLPGHLCSDCCACCARLHSGDRQCRALLSSCRCS